uniref:Uncharacterized protein n=1 Tax=Arundo donax TaxID=35708 RepID=A0A0A9G978_ARUDO
MLGFISTSLAPPMGEILMCLGTDVGEAHQLFVVMPICLYAFSKEHPAIINMPQVKTEQRPWALLPSIFLSWSSVLFTIAWPNMRGMVGH